MASFAELDSNNVVLRVLSIPDDEAANGQTYLAETLGLGGTWLQTSYTGAIRVNYAGIGYSYDSTLDAFIAPQPFSSWILDRETCQWVAPVPYPTDGGIYQWNESTLSWIPWP